MAVLVVVGVVVVFVVILVVVVVLAVVFAVAVDVPDIRNISVIFCTIKYGNI